MIEQRKNVTKMPVEHSPSRSDQPANNADTNLSVNADRIKESENVDDIYASQLRDIKITTFWQSRPKLWFVSLDSEFAAFKIRSDEAKYKVTIRHLDEQTMLAVADILEQPPESNKYETLKNALIERFLDSVEKQMRILLNETELGDKKPSILLREMRALAGSNISDSVLRILWLQRLPARVQEVLVVLEGISLD